MRKFCVKNRNDERVQIPDWMQTGVKKPNNQNCDFKLNIYRSHE